MLTLGKVCWYMAVIQLPDIYINYYDDIQAFRIPKIEVLKHFYFTFLKMVVQLQSIILI